ncbi:hypothetical protein V6N13_114048 [Hibiscus sabdariffa]
MEPYFSRWKAYARCFLGSQASRPSFRDVVLNRGGEKRAGFRGGGSLRVPKKLLVCSVTKVEEKLSA